MEGAQGHPQTSHQLVHAERLAHVVVRAGVERGHFLGFGGAGREHDDRHCRPTAQLVDDFDTRHVGQAEVEHDGVGMAACGECERLGSGCSQLHFVAAGAQIHIERTEDGRLVVDHEDGASWRVGGGAHGRPTGRVNTIVVPPPGVSSTAMSPPIARTNPRATASPRPTPLGVLPRPSPRRWNGSNTWLALVSGDAGSVVDHPDVDVVTDRDGSTRTTFSIGDHATALSTTLARARSRSPASTSTGGTGSLTSMTTRAAPVPSVPTAV